MTVTCWASLRHPSAQLGGSIGSIGECGALIGSIGGVDL